MFVSTTHRCLTASKPEEWKDEDARDAAQAFLTDVRTIKCAHECVFVAGPRPSLLSRSLVSEGGDELAVLAAVLVLLAEQRHG